MKLQLHHVEIAVRKQFTWIEDPMTRWSVNPQFYKGVKGMGATVFIGVASQLGFELDDIKEYIDLTESDVDEKLKAFNTRMKDMLMRRVEGTGLDKVNKEGQVVENKDVTYLMNLKAKMVISYIRIHYMKEYLPTHIFNH